jgi:hypothetical protein
MGNDSASASRKSILNPSANARARPVAKTMPIKLDTDRERYLEGFRQAGLA